jgi:hypothetical protein
VRQSRNYAAVNETQRQSLPRTRSGVEEQRHAVIDAREPRNYDALRATEQRVDREVEQQGPQRPAIHRSWTHHGDMVSQQGSARVWDKQNQELIRMSDNQSPGAGREGDGQPARNENDPELQEARAAVEEARRREAAERARMQERDRGGPER